MTALQSSTVPRLDDALPTSDPVPVSGWLEAYRVRLVATDVLAVSVAVLTAQLVRFGVSNGARIANVSFVSYSVVSVLMAVSWVAVLGIFRSQERKVLGDGAEEYRRVAHASLSLFGAIAIVSFLLKVDVARGYLAVAFPLGLVLILLGRKVWRSWLAHERLHRRCLTDVVVVGSHRAASSMAAVFERQSASGYRVVGVCEPGWSHDGEVIQVEGRPVPVLGDETAVLAAIRATRATMVAVSNTESLGVEGMRALAWELETARVDLVVAPGVVDVAGPRLHVRPVSGLPLLQVDKPQYQGASKFRKLALDLVGSTAALLVLSPVMLVVALLVKLTSPGPVLYRSERIGLKGEPFPMLKFRSMRADADQHRARLLGDNEGSGPLFKMRHDPRVTPLGRVLRRFSLDELPQLFNVLRGDMSIVGPRPPLRAEVATYSDLVRRRLLVKPGITGLWQVSGRSDLSWEESVRLDLYYVENWSFLQDLIIVWRTLKAVLGSHGAY